MSSLLEMEDAVDSCSSLFSKRLDEIAKAGKAFDLGVSRVIEVVNSVASCAKTVTRPGSNTMPSTSSVRSLSMKSWVSSNEAVMWMV